MPWEFGAYEGTRGSTWKPFGCSGMATRCTFDPMHRLLGIPISEDAARHFVLYVLRCASTGRRGAVIAVRKTAVQLAVLFALVVGVAGGLVATSHATTPPPLPPPGYDPTLPKGPHTSCTMTGPAWAEWGIHTPNAPPGRGNRYRVLAWGVPCSQVTVLLRTFFPKIPPHPVGKLSGGPKGFTCKGESSGRLKNRDYAGGCLRLTPAAMFSWGPNGVGKVG
jgi:hypothetical protein